MTLNLSRCKVGVSKHFPWYDSRWLTRYVLAKKYIAQHHPAQLDPFTEAFSPLRTRADFELKLYDSFFIEEQVKTIQTALRTIKPPQLETHELIQHGRFVVHDHPMLIDLHAAVAPLVGELVGEKVEPLYTFIALYNRNGQCPVHLDAPVSKWTLDFCIEQSEPWPIAFSEVIPWPEDFGGGHDGWEERIRFSSGHRFSSVSMEPGQAVIFSGSSQWHYREPFKNPGARSHCSLLFMHFIPAGMKGISEWKNWESIFSAPGLTEAIG